MSCGRSRCALQETRHQNVVLGDSGPKSRFGRQFPHTETSPYVRNATISRHFERDPIPYALETDWPVEAAGFEPLHLRIGIHQDSQPGGQDSNLRISNCRCADRTLKNELSGVQSTVQFSFGRDEVQQI